MNRDRIFVPLLPLLPFCFCLEREKAFSPSPVLGMRACKTQQAAKSAAVSSLLLEVQNNTDTYSSRQQYACKKVCVPFWRGYKNMLSEIER